MLELKFGPLHILLGKASANYQNAPSRTSWNRIKSLVKKRDDAICYICHNKADDGTADHVIPLSKGGTDSLDNLSWICNYCNSVKSDSLLESPQKIGPSFPGRITYFLRWFLGASYHYEITIPWGCPGGNIDDPSTWKDVRQIKSHQRIRHFIRRIVFWPDFEGETLDLPDMIDFDPSLFIEGDTE